MIYDFGALMPDQGKTRLSLLYSFKTKFMGIITSCGDNWGRKNLGVFLAIWGYFQ